MSTDTVEIISQNEIEKTLESFEFAIEQTLECALEYNVCSQWAAEEAINLVAKVKSYSKKIDEVRKRINEPYKKMINYNNDKAKPFTDRLERIEYILKGKIDSWKRKFEEEQKQKEEEAKLFQAAVSLEANPFMAVSTDRLKSSDALAYERSEWKFQVESLSEVPLQYLMVNEEKVKALLKAGMREIPGLKIYEEKKTIIRSR